VEIRNNEVTVADVHRALDIWGPSIPGLKGKTKQTPPPRAEIELKPVITQQQQSLEIDIFFIQQVPFLIGVLSPMQYCMTCHLKDRTAESIGKAIKSMISVCAGNNIEVALLRSDNEKGVIEIIQNIQDLGINVELSPPGGHVPLPERKIQQIKSVVRCTKASVAWEMPKLILIFCVLFATGCVNVQRITSRPLQVSPFQQFTGRQLDHKLHLKAPFGSYAQSTVATTNNTMNERTNSVIVLGGTVNKTGSYRVYDLNSKKVLIRHNIKVIPTPNNVITHLNNQAKKDFKYSKMIKDKLVMDEDVTHDNDDDEIVNEEVVLPEKIVSGKGTQDNYNGESSEHRGAEKRRVRFAASAKQDSETHAENGASEEEVTVDYWSEDMTSEIHDNNKTADKEEMLVLSVKKAISQFGDKAKEAVRKELKQMIDKRVWHPVMIKTLTLQQKKAIIRSSMFLKEKYDSMGKFEKLKARLVANGNMQDKALYPDMSSPTAATSSVFAIAAIAAHESRGVDTLDINGAYLNADMHTTGVEVYMRIDGPNLNELCKVDGSYKKYVNESKYGNYLIVNLDKALYGCVESAKLWYDDLKQTLDKIGYKVNKIDECVFNKGVGDEQCTIALHVDDMIITSKNNKHRKELIEALKGRYTEGVTVHEGPIVSYLGMTFDWSTKDEVKISQEGYINDLLGSCGVDGESKTPASNELFEIDDKSNKLDKEQADWFHRQVAKLLYLAKRTKPECLTAVAFLATRVTKSTEEDKHKLSRLLKYVRSSKNIGIRLKPGNMGISVRCYVDAAYGLHEDGKSVTGSVIVIGEGGPIHAKSSKQKIVTKSSTEAEFVGTSDSVNQALYLREFLLEQGHDCKSVQLYQDNQSCMTLIKKGKSRSERTRHMSIRQFWITERVNNGEIVVEYLPTESMVANLLTKPVQGSQFVNERKMLTNWEL
jgi:hypothetical protein